MCVGVIFFPDPGFIDFECRRLLSASCGGDDVSITMLAISF